MGLNSSSTQSDALAQYNDNLDWDGDITKARLALEAIRWLLINRPQQLDRHDRSINYESLETELKRLNAFVEQYNRGGDNSGGTRLAEF